MANQYTITIPFMDECPFCNSDNLESKIDDEIGICQSYVHCRKCGANGPIAAEDKEDVLKYTDKDVRKMFVKKKAIEKWNAVKR